VKSLKTITLMYAPREDRILAAINHGTPNGWACWVTRRLAVMLLEHAAALLAKTSVLAQRAPADIRGQMVEFERDAAMAETARAMGSTPPGVYSASNAAAELLERIDIVPKADRFELTLRGLTGSGVTGVVARVELERILQMLKAEVDKAGWLGAPAKPPSSTAVQDLPGPRRH
jgi:hypothetical protein